MRLSQPTPQWRRMQRNAEIGLYETVNFERGVTANRMMEEA